MRTAAFMCLFFLLGPLSYAQTTAHDKGLNGLEAWADDSPTRVFRKNAQPHGILIARHGKIIRRIGHNDGGPFFWNVMLLPDGERIAYQYGPFHAAMSCTLMDIATGKRLETVSCFTEEEVAAAPEWVKQLDAHPRGPAGPSFHAE